jgi:hypothetical protein
MKWGVSKEFEFVGNLPGGEFIQLIISVAQLRTSSIINYLSFNYYYLHHLLVVLGLFMLLYE